MTWAETLTFTEQTVLANLEEIVNAEESGTSVETLNRIAEELPVIERCYFLLILTFRYKILLVDLL
jgi:hypothetical protein